MRRNPFALSPGQEGKERLIRILHEHRCMLSAVYISEINNLTYKRRARLHDIVLRLSKHNMLNIETFTEALRRVSLHVDSVALSQVEKEKSKISTKVSLDSGVTYFFKRKLSPEPIISQHPYRYIRRGYEDAEAKVTRWAIKRVEMDINDPRGVDPIVAAKKEAKYNRFMGRQSFFYSHVNEVRTGYEWQAGEDLYQLKDSIAKLSIKDRLQLLASVSAEVNKMHHSLLVHKDIHAGNVIREPGSLKVKFIDFELSRKANTPDDFEDDVKDIHYLIKEVLFTDIYRKRKPVLRERAVMLLDRALKEKEPHMRCTSQQALNYCNLLLEHFDDLNETRLQDILNATLNRSTFDVEDVYRGSERPSRFAVGFNLG